LKTEKKSQKEKHQIFSNALPLQPQMAEKQARKTMLGRSASFFGRGETTVTLQEARAQFVQIAQQTQRVSLRSSHTQLRSPTLRKEDFDTEGVDDEPDEILRRGQLARKLNGEIVSWELRVVTLTADHITISSDSVGGWGPAADAGRNGASAGARVEKTTIVRERIKLLDITSLGAMGDADGNAEAIQQAHGKSYSGGMDADNLTRKMKSIESLTHEKIHKMKQTGTFHGLEYLHSFKIHVAHLGRTYYFKARNPDETTAWIAGRGASLAQRISFPLLVLRSI